VPAVVADLLPFSPTANREFTGGQRVAAFVRVFQSGAVGMAPVTIDTRVYDAADATKFSATADMGTAASQAPKGAAFQVALPLASLTRGPYLLSLDARLPDGKSVRQDLLFRVR